MAWADEVAAALEGVVAGGAEGAYDEGFGPLTVTVPAQRWPEALTRCRDDLGCGFFDWLSAVDELAEGFSVLCHLARLPGSSAVGLREIPTPSQTNRPVQTNDRVQHLLVRTTLPREQPTLASVVAVYAGAGWHERETTEMFGIAFTDAPQPPTAHLLLPEEFEGHPLRKDFVLASRVAKPWPGAKEPGESDHGGPPSRRRTRPPGVPDDEAWGPRDPGSPAPDPLAHAQPGAGRPRRTPRERPAQPADRDETRVTRRRVAEERHSQQEGEPGDG